MKKLSKLTALLLALVLALSVPLQVVAESETIDTKSEYMDVADALLKLKIMAYTDYGEYWDFARLIEESDFEEFFFGLNAEERNEMAAYIESLFWDSLIAYTRVAPLPELDEEQNASTLSLQARDGDTATVAETTDNGLYTNKTVSEPDDNGYFTITLENYATGKVTTTTTTTTKPVDIVLVLDFSKSMSGSFDSDSSTSTTYEYVAVDPSAVTSSGSYWILVDGEYVQPEWCSDCESWTDGSCNHGWFWDSPSDVQYTPVAAGTTETDTNKVFYVQQEVTDDSGSSSIPSDIDTKIEALQYAVNNFIQNVNDQYTDTANHRISIISYNTNATVRNDWTYASDANLDDLKMTDTERDNWQDTGTNTHLGLSSALTQLNELADDSSRQQVVVLFTDGVPGTSQNDFSESAAVSAVTNAKSIKDTGATVYSVAVLTGADPTATISTSATTDTTKINAMLHAISSNYKEATASYSGSTLNTTLGTINPLADTNSNGVIDSGEPSYYLTADSPASLNNIFQQISSSIQSGSSSVTLDETTIVRDVVTPYFEIPYVYVTDENGEYVLDANGEKIKDYTAAEITIQTADYAVDADGNTYFKDPVTADCTYTVDGNILDVTGFDFSANPCMVVNGVAQGKKLIITFKIKTVAGFLGGNDVVTNTSASGIWEKQDDGTYTEFEAYPIPDVDVQVPDLEILAADQHIYLGNYADLDELLQSFSVTYNIVDGNDNKVSGTHTVDTILNHYTELVFTLKDKDEKVLATYTIDDAKDSGTWTYAGGWANEMGEGNKTLKLLLTEDTPFYITYTATSASNPENNSTGKLTAWVYVYTPEVTFQDSVEQYMATMDEATQTAYYEGNNKLYTYSTTTSTNADGNEVVTAVESTGVVWRNTTKGLSTENTMSGLEPKLTFTYTEVEEDEEEWLNSNKQVTATEDVEVTVTTTITGDTTLYGDQAQAKYIRNKVTTCPDECKATNTYVANTADDPAFVVHIIDVYGSLTITKTVTGDGASEDDTFLFTITGPGITGKMQVILKGGESVTINNLKIGDYIVTEDTSWSWRYTCSTPSLTKAVASKTSTEFQFANNLETKTWLDGNAHADNDFNQTTTE